MNDNGGKRVIEELELDERLASAAQTEMRKVVKALPEDGLSLAWRSSLNERLMKTAVRQRRKQILGWIVKPAFGLAVAGALSVVLFTRQLAPQSSSFTSTSGGIEASIVSAHREETSYVDIVGASLTPVEAKNDQSTGLAAPDLGESDLESL